MRARTDLVPFSSRLSASFLKADPFQFRAGHLGCIWRQKNRDGRLRNIRFETAATDPRNSATPQNLQTTLQTRSSVTCSALHLLLSTASRPIANMGVGCWRTWHLLICHIVVLYPSISSSCSAPFSILFQGRWMGIVGDLRATQLDKLPYPHRRSDHYR